MTLSFVREPFGDVDAWTFHLSTGTQAHERLFDAWGRMVRYPMGAVLRDLTYDAADRIASYTHLDRNSGAATAAATALNQSFGYDELGRLTSATGAPGTWRYTYDDNGNRLSATTAGSARAYGVDNASNRLLSIHNPSRVLGYDAAGNTISDVSAAANWTPGYDLSNRLAGLSGSVANGPDVSLGFLYDAHGQRVAKLAAVSPQCTLVGNKKICPLVGSQATTTLYVYDQGGHLLGEYRAADGSAIREYIWLRDIPVAVLDYPTAGAAGTVYYVQADHLNTPRVLTDRAGLVRWTWGGEPFGQSAANDNPSGVGAFTFNLRFPGQYYDVESGFINNGFRVLDASVGRYTQSDPIGLAGGINTYAYVRGNPLSYVDPSGLAQCFFDVSKGVLHCISEDAAKDGYAGSFTSGNNSIAGCKNNSACETKPSVGPIPRGCYRWGGAGKSDGLNRRRLEPLPGYSTGQRSSFQTHCCSRKGEGNPFDSANSCSEGCVVGYCSNVRDLYDFLDKEGGVNTLCVQ